MKRSAVSLVLCTLVTTSASAFAQSATAPAQSAPAPATSRNAPLSESLTGAAKTDFAASHVLMDKGDFAAAYTKLAQAYAESNDPRILFNMAICARGMHDYARMRTLLVRYIREGSASMTPGEKSQVDAALAAMPKMVGTLRLTVSEANATVDVDGEAVGTTPLDDRVYLNPGQHKLTVSKPGFQPVEQVVDAMAGSETGMTVNLLARAEASSAHLVVVSDDAATVVIDGQDVAHGRFDGTLAAGVHDVSVTEAGKAPYSARVNLPNGETRTVMVTLDDEKHGGGALWPWVAGGAAVVAGLAVGGYFVFRTQTETTGTAPTGTLGSVQLSAWRR